MCGLLLELRTFSSDFFNPRLTECATVSAGLGRDLALAALKRGDHVIATARSVNKLADLKDKGADVLQLDVTSPLDELHVVAKNAAAIHGRIDVVVNNAGIESLDDAEYSFF